jgi:putative DNA primase/helicase
MVADSIVRSHGAVMRFNHDSGCWHVFNRQIWEPEPRSVKVGFIRAERWAAANAHLLQPGDFKAASKANFYDGVENILRQRLVIRQEDFDTNPWLLGTPGGTVDLKTGVLRGASPGDFISKSTSVTPLEVANCPRWKKFVMEIVKGDAAAGLFLRQWFGYCLSGDMTEQIFLFLYGPGGNGKSVLVDTMARVAGGYFAKPVSDMYVKKSMQRHMEAVAMLAGARMVSISEVPVGSQWDEARLKEHTGGGAVTANFMRQNSFSYVPQFKITAQGNHKPSFPGGISPAIQRRFRMMLLDFVPKPVDKTLEDQFKVEAAGILRWALDGLCDPATGWPSVGLMIPSVVEAVTDEFVADQDLFAAWLGDRVEKAKGNVAGAEATWKDWEEYRNEHDGESTLYASCKSFINEMERRGYKRTRTMTTRGFDGIALKSKTNTTFED